MRPALTKSAIEPLGLVRRALRPSSVARVLWLAVAALHAWLVLRRFVDGEWGGTLNALRGALCLGGVFYCSLKFWQVATILDAAPRRALAFTLVLLLGHWLLATPARGIDPATGAPQGVAAVLIVAPMLGAGMILAARAARPVPVQRRIVATNRPFAQFEILPLAVSRHAFFLFRRPPPFHS